MKLLSEPNGATIQFATEFRVAFVRALPAAPHTSRWLVHDDAQEESQNNSHQLALFELFVLESQESFDEPLLGLLELHSDSGRAAAVLQDAAIDPERGMALLLRYEPSVFLSVPAKLRQLSVGECASVLLAALALGLRAQSLGYCLGDISSGGLLLDARGGIRLVDPAQVHALNTRSADCCHLGLSLESLVRLASEVSGTDGVRVARTLQQHLESVAFDEHPLEIALHVFSGAITPQPLRLHNELVKSGATSDVPSKSEELGDVGSQPRRMSEETRSRYRPRFASKSPSSRRFFIWVKNRAASAPSTIR